MDEYHKIQSVFKRHPDGRRSFITGAWSLPEFEYLQNNVWEFTEKVDGTNIRVASNDGQVTFRGRTDNAQIPPALLARLQERFFFRGDEFAEMCLYGEGYGAKIQKGGGNYRPDQDFVLFDVRVGEWWLHRDDVEGVAKRLGIDVVPVIGEGTLHDAVRRCQEGFFSQWGEFLAEGVVARPKVEMRARNGSRIITKVKFRDF